MVGMQQVLGAIRRFRRAHSLVVLLDKDDVVIFNFLTKQSFTCNAVALDLLAQVEDWQDEAFFAATLKAYPLEVVRQQINLLVEVGALVIEYTPAAGLDDKYATGWEWGAIAGLFHFAIKDSFYTDDSHEKAERVAVRAALRPSPALYRTNEAYESVTPLPPLPEDNAVFSTMLARRSQRTFKRVPISLQALGNCLAVGLGITGFMEFPVFGRLPLKPTPSGGGRNPYEAYLYVMQVDGLAPGIYHYSAYEHSLGLVSGEVDPLPHKILGEQLWTDDAAAIVFLVADYDRTMWKYPHPSAYRAVLIEAGHIAQNMILAAVEAGLVTAITAAVHDSIAQQAFGLTALTQSVVYALVIGVLDTTD